MNRVDAESRETTGQSTNGVAGGNLEGSDNASRLVIFDLDGTLTTSDSFLSFLLTFGRRHRRVGSLSRTPFRIAAYLSKLQKDFQLKESLMRDYFHDVEPAVVEEHVDWFVDHWFAKHRHPLGTQLLARHQDRGDRILLVSASPDLAVPKIASALAIGEFICTRVERREGRITGKILGMNCKGPQKVKAVQAYLGRDQAPEGAVSYGDTKSDRAILGWVEHGVWVRRTAVEPFDANAPLPIPIQ